jgi:hypothetical protein
MSDYPTLWSLRKILLNKFTEENLKDKNEQFNLYKKEIIKVIYYGFIEFGV